MTSPVRSDGRRLNRRKTNMRALVTTSGGTAFHAQVADLTINGCRIVSREIHRIGQRVTLDFAASPVGADCEVVWRSRFSAGLRFVLRRSRGQGEPAGEALTPGPEAGPAAS